MFTEWTSLVILIALRTSHNLFLKTEIFTFILPLTFWQVDQSISFRMFDTLPGYCNKCKNKRRYTTSWTGTHISFCSMYEGFSCDKSLKDKGFNYLLHHMTQLFSLRASGISYSKSQDATKNNILNCDESPEDHFCPFLKLYFFVWLWFIYTAKVSLKYLTWSPLKCQF